MNYSQILDFLFSQLPMYQRDGASAYKENLNNTIALMEILGHPYNGFKSIHIAGTNGKGSVSHYLASIFQEAGFKTGLYTSPHLIDFRERIKVNGQKIAEEDVIQFVEKNKDEFSRIKPSFFEMTVGMAFQYFNDEKVDIAIIEVGLGGRLDSTNIITPELSVITNIGLDHMQFLGDTKEKIAIEKAGIIKEGVPVVIGETQKELIKLFINQASSKKSPVYFADQEIQKIGVPTRTGWKPVTAYQEKNLKTVLASIEILKKLKYNIDDISTNMGIINVVKNTGLMGRWQVLSKDPLTICDVGHNEDGIKEVIRQIEKTSFDNLHFVFGTVNDKNLETVFPLLPKEATYYFCKANIPRGMPVENLQKKSCEFSLTGKAYNSVLDAYKSAKDSAQKGDLIFIGGSTFVVAEILSEF